MSAVLCGRARHSILPERTGAVCTVLHTLILPPKGCRSSKWVGFPESALRAECRDSDLSGANHRTQILCTSEQHTAPYARSMWPTDTWLVQENEENRSCL